MSTAISMSICVADGVEPVNNKRLPLFAHNLRDATLQKWLNNLGEHVFRHRA